jgi:signal transduction histidine kinase
MDRGSIFVGNSFRAALYGAVAFLLVTSICSVLAIRFVEQELLAEIRSQFAETIAGLRVDHVDAPESFVEIVEDLSRSLARLDRLAVLFDADGHRIAGRHEITPDFEGWTIRDVPASGTDLAPRDFYMTAVQIGDHTLVLGRDLQFVRHAQYVVFRAFLAIGAAMTLVLIGIGYWLSRQSQTKLEAMADTLQRVSDGETGARVAVSPDNDQIDRIARIMNGHLDALSALMHSTTSSAVAIAHDLKRPLSRAYLRLEKAMRDAGLGAQAQEDLDAVHEELAQLTAIFETILRIARIDADHGRPLQGLVDLGELATELGETYEVVAEESGQTLVLDIESGRPLHVRGDPGMLGQMIVNLLQNSVTHCPPGTFITLGVQAAGDRVVLTVSDTGPGLSADERAHALTPFYRANAARTTEGTGLGLALVNTIVHRHGASIALDDDEPGLRVTVGFARV